MQSFNPTKDYIIIQPFVILRRFEALCIIIGKDYACVIFGMDEGLHMLIQPFEGLFYNPSKVLWILCNHWQGLYT